ncbi:hypothetical protein ECZU36_54670 [Escherichia coli]|nr:hypothetical protein ECZU36_54670 [Escherichia coli]
MPEAERPVASIQAKGARPAVPGVVDLSDPAAEARGVAKIVLEAVQIMLFARPCRWPATTTRTGANASAKALSWPAAGRYKGRRADPKRRACCRAAQVRLQHQQDRRAGRVQCGPVKRIWAEVSRAEAKQHGAFVEDALTEADARRCRP